MRIGSQLSQIIQAICLVITIPFEFQWVKIYMFSNNNKMLLANKIKQSQESIDNKSLHFKNFVDTLRQNRYQLLPNSRKSVENSQNNEAVNDHDHPSETNRSEIIHLNRIDHELEKSVSHVSSGALPSKSPEGDSAIRNKLRFNVGNRHRVDRYRLPSYCFQQIKQELDDHLKQVKKDGTKVMFGLDMNKSRRVQKEQDFDLLMQQKGISGEEKIRNIFGLNPNIILKYCTINKLNPNSTLKDVLIFFSRLLDLLNFTLPQPKIEKYKNCLYFGYPIKKHLLYQGMVYYYSGVIYYGELFNNQKHGNGVEIDIANARIYKGEFRDGQMVGAFDVQRDGEKYYGEVENGLYHGRGKLIDGQQIFQGEFRAGNKVYGSGNKKKSKADRLQPSYRSAQRDLMGSKTDYFQFSKNKIHPLNNPNSSMNMGSFTDRKRPSNKRYIDEARDFSYAFNHQLGEKTYYNPEINEIVNSKKQNKVASLRIREVGKLHNSRAPQVQEQQQKPLRSKI